MIVVPFEILWELPMTLMKHHGVQRLDPAKLPPPKYQRPVANSLQRMTIKMHRPLVMPLLILEHINRYV